MSGHPPETLEDALEENEMLRQNIKALNQLFEQEKKRAQYFEASNMM